MSFASDLYVSHLRAADYILKVIRGRGSNAYELIDPDEIDEKGTDFHSLPVQLSSYERHGSIFFDSYSIVEVRELDGKLILSGVDTYGDANESDKVYESDEVDTTTICLVADKIAELEGFNLIAG